MPEILRQTASKENPSGDAARYFADRLICYAHVPRYLACAAVGQHRHHADECHQHPLRAVHFIRFKISPAITAITTAPTALVVRALFIHACVSGDTDSTTENGRAAAVSSALFVAAVTCGCNKSVNRLIGYFFRNRPVRLLRAGVLVLRFVVLRFLVAMFLYPEKMRSDFVNIAAHEAQLRFQNPPYRTG